MNQKKVLGLVLITFVLFSLVLAEDRIDITPTGEPVAYEAQTPEEKAGNKKPDLPDFDPNENNNFNPATTTVGPNVSAMAIGSAAATAAKRGWLGIGVNQNQTVEKLYLADVLQEPFKTLFQVTEIDRLPLDFALILALMFIGVFAFAAEIGSLIRDQKVFQVLFGLFIAIFIALFGYVKTMAYLMVSLFDQSLVTTFVVVFFVVVGFLVLIVLFRFVRDIFRGMKQSTKEERAKKSGMKLGAIIRTNIRKMQKQKDAVDDI